MDTDVRFEADDVHSPYMAFNRRCYKEYIVFHNSVYPAIFSLTEGKEGEQCGLREENVRVDSNQPDSFLTAPDRTTNNSGEWYTELSCSEQKAKGEDEPKILGSQSQELASYGSNGAGLGHWQLVPPVAGNPSIAYAHGAVSSP